MRSVKILPEVLESLGHRAAPSGEGAAAVDRWYVTNGTSAVGPVNLELIARGIEAGRVPLESFVRHEAWKVWRPLAEIALVTGADDEPASDAPDSAALSGEAEADAAGEPPTDDVASPGRPARLDEQSAADALAGSADLRNALGLAASEIARRVSAEALLVYALRGDEVVLLCAEGPAGDAGAVAPPRLLDPALVAAAAGCSVVAEPSPGPAGRAVLDRLSALGVTGLGAMMVPIRPGGRLFGAIETGRRAPFRGVDIAATEAIAAELEQRIEAGGWSA